MAKVANLEFIRPGSAKDIYRVDKETIAFRFTNHYSVFDVGRAPDEIPGKGEAVCACAVKSFAIARAIGVPTCFMEQIDSVTIRVKETRQDGKNDPPIPRLQKTEIDEIAIRYSTFAKLYSSAKVNCYNK